MQAGSVLAGSSYLEQNASAYSCDCWSGLARGVCSRYNCPRLARMSQTSWAAAGSWSFVVELTFRTVTHLVIAAWQVSGQGWISSLGKAGTPNNPCFVVPRAVSLWLLFAWVVCFSCTAQRVENCISVVLLIIGFWGFDPDMRWNLLLAE